MDMSSIAYELNRRCKQYKMDSFQDIRAKIHNLKRVNPNKIFSYQSIREDYAFHIGGRKEIQYNIGFEEFDNNDYLRYGVAFSLESGKGPNLNKDNILKIFLSPPPYPSRIKRYNDFLQESYAQSKLKDLSFWYYDQEDYISNIEGIHEITPDLLDVGYFIFIGKLMPLNNIDYHEILTTFDQLLPMYIYVEGGNINDYSDILKDIEVKLGEDIDNTIDPLISDTIFSDDPYEAEEGKKILKKHYVRERDQEIIKIAKERAKELICEACKFSFPKRYGKQGVGYIEGHHKKPISEMKPGEKTKVEDIALLCSNCHRMIHRYMPYLTIEELKKILEENK